MQKESKEKKKEKVRELAWLKTRKGGLGKNEANKKSIDYVMA